MTTETSLKLTNEQLQDRLEFWQKLLRLGDWRIEVKVVPQSDLDEGVAAHILFDEHTKIAMVQMMRPEDEPQLRSATFRYDMDHELVHELLHLHLLDAEFEQQKNEEFAINAIADALLSLSHGNVPGVA